ncbi:MAG: flavodoxin [Synergistaceae bacterium]|nr:flavodoxin [Synergistaceae bacterium]
MKKLFASLTLLLASAGAAYAADNKILVAVFSRADENYSVGIIEKGNTMVLAEMIAEKTGGELFEIKPAKPYPKDYQTTTEIAKREQNENARPALLNDKDISGYDTIFLGYPNWWGDMPMIIYTFLESHDFSGKTVIPFCTHGGSGLSGTEGTLRRRLSKSRLMKGLAMSGTTAQNNRDETRERVNEWLDGLGF